METIVLACVGVFSAGGLSKILELCRDWQSSRKYNNEIARKAKAEADQAEYQAKITGIQASQEQSRTDLLQLATEKLKQDSNFSFREMLSLLEIKEPRN